MPLEIVRNDITKMRVDAIVNAANTRLQAGGGVCGAIFDAAGADKLQNECNRIGHCDVGSAVITKGYALPAKFIIHTAGPVWQGGDNGEETLLRSCYTEALRLAKEHSIKSIAFPLISSGIFGYPKDQALSVAISAIGEFVLLNDMDVKLVIFDRAAYALSEKLYKSISAYIDDNYVTNFLIANRNRISEINEQIREMTRYSRNTSALPAESKTLGSFEDAVGHVGESFSQMLFRLIDEHGKTDVEIYKRANLDRKLFSKIRSNPKYKPSKNTALALSVALNLNLDQTADLLCRAGYALSPSSRADLIVEYFIRNKNFNIFEINEALFAFDESLLGA